MSEKERSQAKFREQQEKRLQQRQDDRTARHIARREKALLRHAMLVDTYDRDFVAEFSVESSDNA